MLKNKKVIAVILCIGIIASGLGGFLPGYAKSRITVGEKMPDLDKSGMSSLPKQEGINAEPKVYHPEDIPSQKIIIDKEKEEKVLYKGTESRLDPKQKDMFNIGKEEVKDMMQKGYSIKDIFEADEVANEIGQEPEALLEKKAASKESLEQIKKDILKESKEEAFKMLKDRYKKEYQKLKAKHLKEKEIMNLLAYADVNDVKISDGLEQKYRKIGEKVFQQNIATDEKSEPVLSKATKQKYRLSETEAEGLSEDFVGKLKALSEKTGKSVKELVKSYHKSKIDINNNVGQGKDK